MEGIGFYLGVYQQRPNLSPISERFTHATASFKIPPSGTCAMAKGLRSSVKKSNRAKLRTKVFGPVEDARRERLSAKLVELASKPRPTINENTDMDVEDKG